MPTTISRLLPKGSAERRAAVLIGAFLALRLVLSAVFPLIADEAYAVVVSRLPTLSYFDHPPLGFDFARAAAWAFGSEASFFVRLPHVLLGSLSAWLMFLIGRQAFGAEAGFWAAAWYSVAPFFLVSAGFFAVPDGPLNFFLLLTTWLVLPEVTGGGRPDTRRWAVAGLAAGAALLSKYTAVLFGFAAFVVLAATPRGRRLLASPGPWLAGVVAIVCLTPVLIWNLEHDWASFGFQSGRAFATAAHPATFLAVQAGQALFLLPWNWALMLYLVARGLLRPGSDAERMFAALAAVPIVVFDAVSLFSHETLPHWAMPGFLLAFPLLGVWYAEKLPRFARAIRRTFTASTAVVGVLAVLVALQTNTALVTRALDLPLRPGFDWTILSWNALADDFRQRGILADPDAYLLPGSWLIGGKAGHDLGPDLPVAPPPNDARHFGHMDDARLAARRTGYAVTAAWPGETEAGKAKLRELLDKDYAVTGEAWIVPQRIGGQVAFEIVVQPVERR